MKARNKIYLIEGTGLSELITLAEFQRVNTDRVFLTTVLRHPECMPHDLTVNDLTVNDLNAVMAHITDIAKHMKSLEQEYLFYSEYAIFTKDRSEQIQAVEGVTMRIDWVYDIVKSIHKGFGCIPSEIKVIQDSKRRMFLDINNHVHEWNDGVKLLAPPGMFG